MEHRLSTIGVELRKALAKKETHEEASLKGTAAAAKLHVGIKFHNHSS